MRQPDLILSAELLLMMETGLHCESGRTMRRLACALLVARGCRCQEVAGWFDVDVRTVQRWVSMACRRGAQGLVEHLRAGRPSRLNAQQLEYTLRELHGPPSVAGYSATQWSGKRLALHLNRAYGVSLSARSCQRLIASSR